jgi:hypothetical protein
MYLFNKKIDVTIPVPILHQALQIAIYDEFRAQASYQLVIDRFGAIAPFKHIVMAETNHINALLPLLERYAVVVPLNDWYANLRPADSVEENCELGVAAEIQNIQMYDHLLTYISQPDVRAVFIQLRAASLENHLPAFRSCIARQIVTSPKSYSAWPWIIGAVMIAATR